MMPCVYGAVVIITHDTTLLRIRAPRNQSLERGPILMEQAIAAMHSLGTPITLTIANVGGSIMFLVAVQAEDLPIVEAQLYAQYPDCDIEEIHSEMPTHSKANLSLISPGIFPIKRHPQFEDRLNKQTIDPLSGITAALTAGGSVSFTIRPSRFQTSRALAFLPHLEQGLCRWSWYRRLFCRVHLARGWKRLALFPLDLSMGGYRRIESHVEESPASHEREDDLTGAKDKLKRLLFDVQISLSSPNLRSLIGAFRQFDLPHSNGFKVGKAPCLMSAEEIATLWHLPTRLLKTPNIDWVGSRKLEPPLDLTEGDAVLGKSVFRRAEQTFGIKTDDRRRHVYIVGKTGMGKSVLLQNMIFTDVHKDRGLAVIDPHGDLAEAVLQFIPKRRTNDVTIFDPSDTDFPIAFNLLEAPEEQRALVASGIISIFAKIWPDVWSGRMEHILRNTLLALVEARGQTLLGVMRMYANAGFRKSILALVQDPLVRAFWQDEFERWPIKYRTEAVAPIQNKVGQLLSAPLIRNIVGQRTSKLNIRESMDAGKIIIVNLSKGRIGEDNANFLGSMLVTKFQIDAMSRAEIPEADRRDFHLYIDEFQNFATGSFATILSEARKYRLSLTMAHQYISQLVFDERNTRLRDAVFGNCGTLITFQVGSDDAEVLANQFGDRELSQDIIALPKYHAYLRLMIDGITSQPFSMTTFPSPDFPVSEPIIQRIRDLSRQRYATERTKVESQILE